MTSSNVNLSCRIHIIVGHWQGYVGSPSFLRAVIDVHRQLKEANPEMLFICDPVSAVLSAPYRRYFAAVKGCFGLCSPFARLFQRRRQMWGSNYAAGRSLRLGVGIPFARHFNSSFSYLEFHFPLPSMPSLARFSSPRACFCRY